MALNYEDIIHTGTLYIDARETERGKRFCKFLDNYLKTANPNDLHALKPLRKMNEKRTRYVRDDEVNYTTDFKRIITDKMLEIGDYAFEECAVEFKSWEDYKNSLVYNHHLTNQVERMYLSDFKGVLLLVVCEDFKHYYNNSSYYKGNIRFGDKVNVQLVPNEKKAFECMIYYFRMNAHHLLQAPRRKMLEDYNAAKGILWATRSLGPGEINKIMKAYCFNTFKDVQDNLTVDMMVSQGVRAKAAERCYKVLHSIPLWEDI